MKPGRAGAVTKLQLQRRCAEHLLIFFYQKVLALKLLGVPIMAKCVALPHADLFWVDFLWFWMYSTFPIGCPVLGAVPLTWWW